MKRLIPFTLVLIAASCIKKADVDLPPRTEKLVVTCFISPQESSITAVVRSSIPKFASFSFKPNQATLDSDIKDAVVTISDGSSERNIPFNPLNDCYQLPATDYQVVAGRSYTLRVTAVDGKSVQAVTAVPEDSLVANIPAVAFRKNTGNELDYDVYAEVPDVADKPTYVAVFGKTQYLLRQRGNIVYNEADNVILMESDEKVKRTAFTGKSSQYYSTDDSILTVQSTYFVLNCSRDFFHYNESVRRAAGLGGDPFSEPVFVYTNVTNGFGCFGAYTMTRKQHTVR